MIDVRSVETCLLRWVECGLPTNSVKKSLFGDEAAFCRADDDKPRIHCSTNMPEQPPESCDDSDVDDSDHMLLQRFREGEEDAATELFLKYSARLQALARAQTSQKLASRFDPEDVVQSVFRTFFRRAANGLYDVPAGDELWQLLLVLALNKIRELGTKHRAQKRDVGRTDTGQDFSRFMGSGDKETSVEVLRVVLNDFLDSLPATQARVARLRMEGFQVEEIAADTKRSKRSTERVLNDLRKRLLDQLDFD